MKVTAIPIVIGALEIILKGLVKGWEQLEIWGRAETPQNTEFVFKWILPFRGTTE